jgi:hypothetical protein
MLLSAGAQELAELKSWDSNVANLAKRPMVDHSTRLNLELRITSSPLEPTPGPARGPPCRVRSGSDPNIG